MISVNYINNGCEGSVYNDECSLFEQYLSTCMDDIYEAYSELKSKTDFIMLESSIMGDIDEDKQLILESENKNYIEMIGKKIIEIGKKFIEMIDSLIEKVKNIGFKFKSNEKKMQLLIKKHPELAKEKIQVICDEGALDFSDIDSLAKLDKEFDTILRMSKEKNVDPNTLRGRWEKAKKKFVNPDDDTATKIKKVAGAGVTILTLGAAIAKFGPDIAKWLSTLRETRTQEKKKNYEAYQRICDANKDMVNAGYTKTMGAIYNERKGLYSKAIQKHQNAIDRLVNSITTGIDKVIDSKAGRAVLGDIKSAKIADMKHASDVINKQEADKVYNSRMATNKADMDFRKKYKNDLDDMDNQKTYNSRMTSNKADMDFKSDPVNASTLNKITADDAEAKETGRIRAQMSDLDSLGRMEQTKTTNRLDAEKAWEDANKKTTQRHTIRYRRKK